MKIGFVFIVTCVAVIAVTNVFSQEKKFQSNGYEIDVKWREKKGDSLELSGKIIGGTKKCNKLTFEFYVKNYFSGESVRFEGFLHNYRPDGKNNFKISRKITKPSDTAYHQEETKTSWYLDNYTMDCWNWNSRLQQYHGF